MDTEVVAYTHTQIFGYKKNEVLPFMTTWMEMESIMESEIPYFAVYNVHFFCPNF